MNLGTPQATYGSFRDMQGIAPPDRLDEQQVAAWHKDAAFLTQLLDNSKVNFQSPYCVAAACMDCSQY